jgi:hypothetical protein
VNIRKEASGRIKIIKVPSGEAPHWVRQGWYGLVLPCKPVCGYADTPSQGIQSGKLLRRREFDVPQREALEILAKNASRPAAWWRAHGFPQGDDYFCFGADEAEVLSGVAMQSIAVYDDMETGRWGPTFVIAPPGGRP